MRLPRVSFLIAALFAAIPSFQMVDGPDSTFAESEQTEAAAQGIVAAGVAVLPADDVAQEEAGDKKKRSGRRFYNYDYTFTDDWFTPRIENWTRQLEEYKGKPLQYLEVGLFEGRSAFWMLENVLTHPRSHLTGIDIFEIKRLKHRWLSNVVRSKQANKITTITGYSQAVMRTLPLNSYDIIYIDGGHMAHDVLADATLAWDLLKEGGMLIFDDFELGKEWNLPIEMRPHGSIESFITAYRMYLEVVHRDYQIFLRKLGAPCPQSRECFRIGGGYVYRWDNDSLFRESDRTGGAIDLSERESEILRDLLRTREFGETQFTISPELREDAEFQALCERLELRF